MKFLVTGASGFVGSHLLELLSKENHQVFSPSINLLNATDLNSALADKKFDGVFHLAAIAAVGTSHNSPTKIIRNNIFAQLNLLEALLKQKSSAKILIICSADEYGQNISQTIAENAPLMPTNPYAVSKIGQDYLALQYHLAHSMKIIRVRPFNHIGERQSPGFVVPDFAQQIAVIEKSGRPGNIFVGDLKPIRDFTDVKDMVKAYLLALTKGVPGDVYNLGSGQGVSIQTILDKIISLSPAKITVKTEKSRLRTGEVSRLVCNPQKFNRLTGWKPTIPLDDTLLRVLEYWRNVTT